MQLTEKERDLLVDRLIESLWQFPLEGTHRSVREMIVHKAVMPAVEGLLADRAVPEPDAEAIEQKRRRDMNETRRDALVADVQKALESAYDTGWECGTGDVMREVTAGEEPASVIVQKVTAARDAEIRKRLLSEGAVIEAVESIRTSPVLDRSSYHSLPPDGPGAGEPGKWLGHELRREWREYVGRPAIEAALTAAGITGAGQEGGE